MKSLEEVIAYCERRAAHYHKAWGDSLDHLESTDWYLEPVAFAFEEVVRFIKTGEESDLD